MRAKIDPETGFSDEDGLCNCGCDYCTSKMHWYKDESGYDRQFYNCPDEDCDGRFGGKCERYYEDEAEQHGKECDGCAECSERIADRILAGVE